MQDRILGLGYPATLGPSINPAGETIAGCGVASCETLKGDDWLDLTFKVGVRYHGILCKPHSPSHGRLHTSKACCFPPRLMTLRIKSLITVECEKSWNLEPLQRWSRALPHMPIATSSAQWQLQSRKHIKGHRVNESGGSKLDFELKGDVLYEIEAIRLGLNHRLLEASCEKGERLRCNLIPSRTESLEGNAAAYRRREKLRLCTECASEEEGIQRQGREDGAVEDGRNLRCPLQRRKVWEAVWGEAG